MVHLCLFFYYTVYLLLCTSLKRLSGLDEAKSTPRREGYLHLRRCASTSRSRHPRGQYPAGDAPGLQPIPEHSRAGNQLTEDNDKRRRIEARNTGSNGRQSGGQTPRYPVRGDVNPIVLDSLQRCIGVLTAAKTYQWVKFMQTYLPRCLKGEEIEG